MGVLGTTNEELAFNQNVIDRVMRLRIIDDTFFRFFANNKEAINEIIDGYLGKHINIIDTNPQATLTNIYREVILDSLSYLEDNSYIDIEMQNQKEHNDLKRCRYHASLITANKTNKKCEFDDIPNVVVIYIMDYDGYNNVPISHISSNDGYELYLVSNKRRDDSAASELTQLLSDSSLEIHNDNYPAICACFNRIKRDKEAISEMCKVMEEYADEKVNEKTIVMIKNAMKNTKRTFEEVCGMLGISSTDMKRYKEMI